MIAGTATMTTNAIQRAGSRRQAEHEAYDQQQTAAPPFQPTAGPPADDLVDKLAQLAQLRDSGALSGAEFEAAKATLLG
ncbi:MAG: SHOCT domain-containing protein [Jiangellaceae bacterium]